MGVVVERRPGIKAPQQLRSLLPQGAAIRILTATELAPHGETVVIYETDPGSADPFPHIAIVSSGKVKADFDLARIVEYGEGFTPVAYHQFKLGGEENALAIAFRNLGDGAATLFVVIKKDRNSYETTLSERVSQGRLKIREGQPTRLELWQAREDLDEGISCTWCRHRYEVETREWRGNNFASVYKRVTNNTLNPYSVAETPLIVLKSKGQ